MASMSARDRVMSQSRCSFPPAPASAAERSDVRQHVEHVTYAKKQLGGTERPGGDDHDACGLAAGDALAGFQAVEPDAIGAVGERLDLVNQVQRADFGMVF